MRRFVSLKICGIVYFVLDIIIQVLFIFSIGNTVWLWEYSLHNAFFTLCFIVAAFDESKFLMWLALFAILTVIILSIYVLFTFIRRKDNFIIPLVLTLLNVIVHIIYFAWDLFSYVGLLYKIIGCVIFTCIVCKKYMNRNNKCEKNNL